MTATALSRSAGNPPSPGERFGKHVLFTCAALSALLGAAVIVVVALETVRFFGQVSPARFFGGLTWTPLAEEPGFGVLPLVAGTAQIAAGATLLALPVGLLTAVFLRYYASGRTASVLNAVVTLLACIPAVVYGYFALNYVTPAIRSVWPGVEGFNGISACLVVGLMILPTIVLLSREALGAVPNSLLEEGVALGATRRRVLVRLVVPAAAIGIAGSVVMAAARAVGETMIVTLAAGNPTGPTWNPLEGVRTLTTFLAQASLGDIPAGSIEYGACFAVAAVLFLLTCGMHAAGGALMARDQRGKREAVRS
ncbi:MAG: phosphate ABC transporter permease subunit PstC [Gemmatimonadota bacterium]|nr:phosphate ABC transporter permease subunit PstC [Gemmatimonadota bacterium]MDE2863806.1 phosphate ABC transporter permease subunit PstC [Gemmatimonadota bacterium]MXV94490.1 phosphate ABC transporter permease subunit PstC [Gemmatimonadota bacterium]MYE18147.1 phosphate ABC transporter permease subunit PstC [Gemmatimonadota bacterium]